MEETPVILDTYTKKTSLYYILLILLIIPLLFWILTNIFSIFQLSPEHNRYLGAFIIFETAIYLFFRNSFLKMYIKDGEISFDNKSITLNSSVIALKDIKKIIIIANDYKGKQKGTSDGSGNWIEIYDLSDKPSRKRFVINSEEQCDRLQKVLLYYSARGLTVSTSGF